MKHFLLDTNVLLRFLTQDHEHSARASALFRKADKHEATLYLDGQAIAESIYVLMGQYRRTRQEIAEGLLAIIRHTGIETFDAPIAADALTRFAATNVDFADAWLAARAAESGLAIASFDKDFDKFKDIKRTEPKA